MNFYFVLRKIIIIVIQNNKRISALKTSGQLHFWEFFMWMMSVQNVSMQMPSSWVSPIAFILQCFFSLRKSRLSCFRHRNVNESYGFYSQFPWWLQSDLADCTNTHTHTHSHWLHADPGHCTIYKVTLWQQQVWHERKWKMRDFEK